MNIFDTDHGKFQQIFMKLNFFYDKLEHFLL